MPLAPGPAPDDKYPAATVWGSNEAPLTLVARTVSMDYAVVFVEIAVGLVMLPFNMAHLGLSAFGLLVLTAAITNYFSMLELGYGSAIVKFAAHYRAHRDASALNEIVSTMFFVFAIIGVLTYCLTLLVALNFHKFFDLLPGQADSGRSVLLILGAYVAIGFPFTVFGGVVNGFQRKYLNGGIAMVTSVVVALANVAVLLAGYGLVELVAVTTTIRVLSYFLYRLNAYRVFPALHITLHAFRFSRLKEVTAFSAFVLVIDIANKLNYSADTIVIGAFMSTAAVAVWAVAARLTDITERLADQLNGALFPIVVDSAALGESDRLRLVLVQGTRLSLATVIPIASCLALVAEPLVRAWVGPQLTGSVPIVHVLASVVIFRVGTATAATVLKGAGEHRMLAYSNLSMAVVNVILSIALIGRFGLVGVAFGTLIPLAAVSVSMLFPAACRRAALPVNVAFRQGVWPALWPALVIAGLVGGLRVVTGGARLVSEAIIAASLYPLIFLFLAINRTERGWYGGKLRQLLKRANPPPIV